ncbi:hypothetical protein KCU68_g189, partial [Aureobasidium melanogenum]
LLPDYLEHQCSSSRGANRVTNLSADNSATRKACIFQNAHVLCQEDRIGSPSKQLYRQRTLSQSIQMQKRDLRTPKTKSSLLKNAP